jgi:conjugal transfer pilus assembly protein TraW
MRLKALLIVLLIGEGSAKNLGTYGPTFEIAEPNLLEMIQQKLQSLQDSGKIELHQQEIQKRVEARIKRPKPVPGINKAETSSSRLYDPSFVLNEDIKDHQGRSLGKVGSSYNPLDYSLFGEPFLFIDGDDLVQLQWALSQPGKIVLVSGSPLELEQQYQRPFYFDQGGILTKKFAIDQVPARVSQQGKMLLIEFERYEVNQNG